MVILLSMITVISARAIQMDLTFKDILAKLDIYATIRLKIGDGLT